MCLVRPPQTFPFYNKKGNNPQKAIKWRHFTRVLSVLQGFKLRASINGVPSSDHRRLAHCGIRDLHTDSSGHSSSYINSSRLPYLQGFPRTYLRPESSWHRVLVTDVADCHAREVQMETGGGRASPGRVHRLSPHMENASSNTVHVLGRSSFLPEPQLTSGVFGSRHRCQSWKGPLRPPSASTL